MTTKEKLKMTWQVLKFRVLAKLARINRECLLTLLAVCALATVAVLALVIAIKQPPLRPPLVLLSLAAVVAIWDRLRRPPQTV